MKERKYRVKVKKGILWYTAKLQIKTLFYWRFVEGYKIKIGNESELTKTVENWCNNFNIGEEQVITNL